MYKSVPFRFVYPFSTSDVLAKVNEKGELVGIITKVVIEANIFIYQNFNMTWVAASKHLRNPGEISHEGMGKIGQDKADGAFSALLFLDGLPENVTATPIVNDQWCKLASPPKLESSVIS